MSYPSQRTLILGAGGFARLLAREITARPECGYHLLGMVAEQGAVAQAQGGCALLGSLEDIGSILTREQCKRIVGCLPDLRGYLSEHRLVEARVCRNIEVEDGKEVYERITGMLAIEALTPSSMIFSRSFRPSRLSLGASRLLSLLAAGAGLLILAPLFLLIALAIKVDSRGPVLFVQNRIGLGGKSFPLYTSRTMHPAHTPISEWAGDNKHRITRVGRFLRKFRLDELPQFLNVLRGDMNLVGPRPHPASNFELFVLVSRNTPECGGQIPYYSLRSMVRPGITGWAQVRYRYANNLNEEIEKLRFDLYYVKHYSFWLDLRILFETVKVVVTGHEVEDGTEEAALTPPVADALDAEGKVVRLNPPAAPERALKYGRERPAPHSNL